MNDYCEIENCSCWKAPKTMKHICCPQCGQNGDWDEKSERCPTCGGSAPPESASAPVTSGEALKCTHLFTHTKGRTDTGESKTTCNSCGAVLAEKAPATSERCAWCNNCGRDGCDLCKPPLATASAPETSERCANPTIHNGFECTFTPLATAG